MTGGKLGLKGIVTATPTPVAADGSIDVSAATAVAEHVVAGNATGIAPVGGTGEATALTPEQRLRMLEITVEAVNGRIPVIPGILSPGIGEALAAARDFATAGADMLMVVTPYYARATQGGIVDYYKAISDAVDLPIMLYEIPYRTGIQLEAETTAALGRETRVTAMKACSPDLPYQMRCVALAGADIDILTGEENVYPAHVAMGARGGVLASSLLFPNAWNYLHALAAGGRNAEATAFHRRLMPYVSMLYREHNPGPLRAALDIVGMPQGECLPPLRPASEETKTVLAAQLPDAFRLEDEARALLAEAAA